MSFNVNQKLEITKLRISYLAIYIKVVVVTPYIRMYAMKIWQSPCTSQLSINIVTFCVYML